MSQYLLIESRDPFESNDVGYYYDLAKGLVEGGNQVTLFLVQNGVLPARPSAHSAALSALARSGVTVNSVGAGWIDAGGFLADENMKRQLERYLPYKRLAEPEEISGAVVYLASDAATYLTGQVVWIEGGALSHV